MVTLDEEYIMLERSQCIEKHSKYEYCAKKAPCNNVEHIVKFLNEMGKERWCMVAKVSSRRFSEAPTFYFVRRYYA